VGGEKTTFKNSHYGEGITLQTRRDCTCAEQTGLRGVWGRKTLQTRRDRTCADQTDLYEVSLLGLWWVGARELDILLLCARGALLGQSNFLFDCPFNHLISPYRR
jgi:hypothetical protein